MGLINHATSLSHSANSLMPLRHSEPEHELISHATPPVSQQTLCCRSVTPSQSKFMGLISHATSPSSQQTHHCRSVTRSQKSCMIQTPYDYISHELEPKTPNQAIRMSTHRILDPRRHLRINNRKVKPPQELNPISHHPKNHKQTNSPQQKSY